MPFCHKYCVLIIFALKLLLWGKTRDIKVTAGELKFSLAESKFARNTPLNCKKTATSIPNIPNVKLSASITKTLDDGNKTKYQVFIIFSQ
jgi:hypothetical protein